MRLPQGGPCGPYWATDPGVVDGWSLARRLAEAFPKTGLWPVLWAWGGEGPDLYAYGHGDPSRADRLDPAALLRRSWTANGFARSAPFPGLAPGATGTARMPTNPFGRALQDSLMDVPASGGWIVMLVPVERPSDILSVLRLGLTEHSSDDELTAILRSWEKRFGAVVTALSSGTIELTVGSPPRDAGQARRLAAEHLAFAPETDSAPDASRLSRQLLSRRTARGMSSAEYWAFGWPD